LPWALGSRLVTTFFDCFDCFVIRSSWLSWLPASVAAAGSCDEFVNRDRQMVFESSSGNGTVCLMTLLEAKDDTSCN
jgi:hypothetical protein